MKYSIDGLVKGKIIKSVEVIKQSRTDKKIKDSNFKKITADVLVVNYLDGTQDIFEFNEKVLNNIEQIMINQAEIYASKKKTKNIGYIISQIGCLLVAGGALFLAVASAGLLQFIIAIVLIIGSGAIALNLQQKKNDLKKYELFIKNAIYKVFEYKNIISNESNFIKSKSKRNCDFSGIRDLDKVSLKELNQIINKVDRYEDYKEKEPKGQKVKSL